MARAVASDNPVVATAMPNPRSADLSVALTVARLRLLRMATDVRRARVDQVRRRPLADPLGEGPLQVAWAADGNGAVELRSAHDRARRRVAPPAPR